MKRKITFQEGLWHNPIGVDVDVSQEEWDAFMKLEKGTPTHDQVEKWIVEGKAVRWVS